MNGKYRFDHVSPCIILFVCNIYIAVIKFS